MLHYIALGTSASGLRVLCGVLRPSGFSRCYQSVVAVTSEVPVDVLRDIYLFINLFVYLFDYWLTDRSIG